MILNDREYQAGETVPMSLQQFNDLEPTGMVERAPVKKAAARASKRARTKAVKQPATQPVTAAPVEPATEPMSSDAAD